MTEPAALAFEDRRLSLPQLDALTDGLAATLHKQNVRVGQRVAVMSSNRPEFIVAMQAIWRLGATAVLISPAWNDIVLRGGLTVQSDQHRVDPALAETVTPGWMRLDAGLRWSTGIVDIDLAVENLLNRSYRQHLSYARNPFAAGMPVWEPGRIVRLQLHAVSPL